MSTGAGRPWRLLAHVVAPAALMLAMIALFFSGVPAFAAMVAPPGNRELGLLEHLQLAALGTVIALAVRAARHEGSRPARRVWAVVAAGAAFVFLEETDYGLHYYELMVSLATGAPPVTAPGVRNVHNLGENTNRMKLVADGVLGVLFLVVPFAPTWWRVSGSRWAADRRRSVLESSRKLVGTLLLAPDSPLRPSRWYAATIGVMVVTAQIPHALFRAGHGPGWLTSNLSEFREVLIYYVFALYTYDVLRRAAGSEIGKSLTTPGRAASPRYLHPSS